MPSGSEKELTCWEREVGARLVQTQASERHKERRSDKSSEFRRITILMAVFKLGSEEPKSSWEVTQGSLK